MLFARQDLAEQAASLAAQGVYVGTSSWKYPGWCGTLYDPARYQSLQLTPADLRELESAAAKIRVQGARYPEHLQKLVGR
jgi:hypothetical protein